MLHHNLERNFYVDQDGRFCVRAEKTDGGVWKEDDIYEGFDPGGLVNHIISTLLPFESNETMGKIEK